MRVWGSQFLSSTGIIVAVESSTSAARSAGISQCFGASKDKVES